MRYWNIKAGIDVTVTICGRDTKVTIVKPFDDPKKFMFLDKATMTLYPHEPLDISSVESLVRNGNADADDFETAVRNGVCDGIMGIKNMADAVYLPETRLSAAYSIGLNNPTWGTRDIEVAGEVLRQIWKTHEDK